MTVKEINERLEIETIVHQTARQIVELIEAATKQIEKLGGEGEASRERILELVND